MVRKISHSACIYAARAEAALCDMDAREALVLAKRSWSLRRNRRAARCAALSLCATGEFAAALHWHRKFSQIDTG
ncbi:MAG: hypothetical protein ACOC41_07730 [Chitinivibrionales bacterium]